LDGEEKKCIQNFSVVTAQKTNASKTKGGWENNIQINKLWEWEESRIGLTGEYVQQMASLLVMFCLQF